MLLANISLPHEGVALERAFREGPEMTVEANRVAAYSTEWVMPCLWVTSSALDEVDEALAADPSVDEIVESYRYDDGAFYQVAWNARVQRRIDVFLDREGTILSASATADGWRLRVRFTSREQFREFRDYVRDRSYSFELLSISGPDESTRVEGDLTPDQREALALAVERGYYEVPRETSTRELADELGTSHQAVSELLRRGVTNLVQSTIAPHGGATS